MNIGIKETICGNSENWKTRRGKECLGFTNLKPERLLLAMLLPSDHLRMNLGLLAKLPLLLQLQTKNDILLPREYRKRQVFHLRTTARGRWTSMHKISIEPGVVTVDRGGFLVKDLTWSQSWNVILTQSQNQTLIPKFPQLLILVLKPNLNFGFDPNLKILWP